MTSAMQMSDVMAVYKQSNPRTMEGQQRMPRNTGFVRPPLKRYDTVGGGMSQMTRSKPPLKDIKGQQSTESAPSPDVSQEEKQEKVFKKRQGSFRRTFSLKSFSQRLQRGSTSGSKSSLSESVDENDEDTQTQKKPKGLHRVGTMPAMRLGQRRKTMDSVTSDDSWSSQREDREGGLWGVVKSRIGSFNFSRQNSQGSSSSIDALAPPKHAAHDHDNVDAVYQVLKQGALLRATEKNEEDDPILAARREKLSAQNSVDTKEADSSSNTEASSETTVVKSSSSSSSIKTSVVTKPPLSSKSQASVTSSVSSSEKTETISIESKQKKVQQTKTTKAEKGFYTYNGMIGASNKGPDFGDIVFKVLDNRGGD